MKTRAISIDRRLQEGSRSSKSKDLLEIDMFADQATEHIVDEWIVPALAELFLRSDGETAGGAPEKDNG